MFVMKFNKNEDLYSLQNTNAKSDSTAKIKLMSISTNEVSITLRLTVLKCKTVKNLFYEECFNFRKIQHPLLKVLKNITIF